jgi:hypothetical protein
VTSGVRLALLFQILKSDDQTWAIVTSGICMYGLSSVCGYAVIESNTHDSLIEANLIIITGCLPTMRLFFRHVTPRLIGKQSARGHSHNPGTKYGTNSKPLQVELKEISVKRTRVYDRMVDEDAISMGSALKT